MKDNNNNEIRLENIILIIGMIILTLVLIPGLLRAETCDVSGDTSGNLGVCIYNAQEGSTIEVEPGRYVIRQRVSINKGVHIKTLNMFDKCKKRDTRCAEFVIADDFSDIDGAFSLDAPNAKLTNIRVNGNRKGRRSNRKPICNGLTTDNQKRNHRYGINISVNAPSTLVDGVASYNGACGANIEVREAFEDGQVVGMDRVAITNNLIENSGKHNREWSDGLTVHSARNMVVANNIIKNSTDIGLIFGGCTNCQVTNNKIVHTKQKLRGSFGGMLIFNWNTDRAGSYLGTIFNGNTINCSKKFRCGFGVLIGARPWISRRKTISDVVLKNTRIRNAQHGLVVTNDTANVSITRISIRKDWTRDYVFPKTCDSGRTEGTVYSISPDAKGVNARPTREGALPVRTSRFDRACIFNNFKKWQE